MPLSNNSLFVAVLVDNFQLTLEAQSEANRNKKKVGSRLLITWLLENVGFKWQKHYIFILRIFSV